MDCQANPRQNHLLGSLPPQTYDELHRHLEFMAMPLGTVLYEAGVRMHYVYFPVTSIVSLLCTLEDGCATETAIVGKEGMLGISLFMGGDTSPSRGVVESAGTGYRMSAKRLFEEFTKGGPVQQLLLRYTQALISHMSQTAVCNRHHTLEQQFCRRLLLCLDRLDSNEVILTQELIANMLGVRRAGVTDAAGKLQRAGLIHCRRGHITVLNRPGLEERTCECYAVVKKEFDRLLPSTATPIHTDHADHAGHNPYPRLNPAVRPPLPLPVPPSRVRSLAFH